MILELKLTENKLLNHKSFEFFIDEISLPEILERFYCEEKAILENWTNVFNNNTNINWNLITKKQFLLEEILDSEIEDTFSNTFSKIIIQNGIVRIREYLDQDTIIIYGCKECGDFGCGGFEVKINNNNEKYVWTFKNDDTNKFLVLEFDKEEYIKQFDKL